LADDFVLVTGRGKVFSKADLIESARKKEVTYERQDEEPGTQKVRAGATRQSSLLSLDKAEQGGNQPITNYGLATLMFALRQAGDTFLARLPCHCQSGVQVTHAGSHVRFARWLRRRAATEFSRK